jgi:hypothetical protein
LARKVILTTWAHGSLAIGGAVHPSPSIPRCRAPDSSRESSMRCGDTERETLSAAASSTRRRHLRRTAGGSALYGSSAPFMTPCTLSPTGCCFNASSSPSAASSTNYPRLRNPCFFSVVHSPAQPIGAYFFNTSSSPSNCQQR